MMSKRIAGIDITSSNMAELNLRACLFPLPLRSLQLQNSKTESDVKKANEHTLRVSGRETISTETKM